MGVNWDDSWKLCGTGRNFVSVSEVAASLPYGCVTEYAELGVPRPNPS